jgi:hypothetical protein
MTTNAIETKLKEASAKEAENNWETTWKSQTSSFMAMLSERCSTSCYNTGNTTAPFLVLPHRSIHYCYQVYQEVNGANGRREEKLTNKLMIEVSYLEEQVKKTWIAHETDRIFKIKLEHLLSVAGVA